jgi:hypothetical protein
MATVEQAAVYRHDLIRPGALRGRTFAVIDPRSLWWRVPRITAGEHWSIGTERCTVSVGQGVPAI